MKKLAASVLWVLMAVCCYAQAPKKPTLMILPSDNWCTQRYFMTTYDNQGLKVSVPNYQQAFREDIELNAVISKIGALMTDKGYSLKDAEQEIKNISMRTAEDNVTSSSSSSAYLSESPLDILKRRAKSDIIIQVWWQVNNDNGGKSVSFTLEAFDAYTSKRIATATGIGKPSNDIIPIQLEKAVKSHIKEFDKQLDSYYSSMKKNGREILLTVRCWDNWNGSLENEYKNEELLAHIQQWLLNNTIKGQYNLSDATENFAQFEQVHIPLYDNNGAPMDARSFAVVLQKHLSKSPYNITSKVMVRGLGEAIIVLGEK